MIVCLSDTQSHLFHCIQHCRTSKAGSAEPNPWGSVQTWVFVWGFSLVSNGLLTYTTIFAFNCTARWISFLVLLVVSSFLSPRACCFYQRRTATSALKSKRIYLWRIFENLEIARNVQPRAVPLLCVASSYQIRPRDPLLEVPSFISLIIHVTSSSLLSVSWHSVRCSTLEGQVILRAGAGWPRAGAGAG